MNISREMGIKMNLIQDAIITLDIDWAPDFAIDTIAQILIDYQVKATWFVTHFSPAIERLNQQRDLFELGIHPNMLPGSTHGISDDEVLTYMKQLVPDAVSMRTHGLYQSTNFLIKAARDYGIETDVSLFLPKAENIAPHKIKWNYIDLLRVPFFWEDDAEMFENKPCWSISDPEIQKKGLKIFNFHPIHLVLNTHKFELYNYLKSIKPLQAWDSAFVQSHNYKGSGSFTFFEELVKYIAGKGLKIKDIVL